MGHAPSSCRDILRRLPHGDPLILVAEALRIDDPGWAAEAAFEVSGDRRLQWQEAKQGLLAAVAKGHETTRLARRAELWGRILKELPQWRDGARNPQAPGLRDEVREAVIADIEAMPDGEWTLEAIRSAAPYAGKAGRQRLLGRALHNLGFEAAGAKAVLRAGPDEDLEQLLDAAPPEVRAAALATDAALDAAWAIQDPHKRAEALRVIIWKEDNPARLESIGWSATQHGDEDRVRVWIQVGGRLDKIGHPAAGAWLDRAAGSVSRIEGKAGEKLARKLAEAQERLAGTPGPTPEPAPKPAAPALPGPVAGRGNTLALVNTYAGGLKTPHLRAAARAAPLCHAFGLDLALLRFPIDDLDAFVAAVESETGIGEGGRYLAGLHAAGRLHTEPVGNLVATTPKPDPAKAHALADVATPVCLLMGIGPQGLPADLMEAAPVHYEITGSGVSLETATAMGILAERLRALAAP